MQITALVLLFSLQLSMSLLYPVESRGETKSIIAEEVYTMGDGETPAAAEAMVLQKAKQRALEEAGTYVQSYTHMRNLELTVDEVKTIAGGVMKTAVLERHRMLEGSGLRFAIKIRAEVSTDNIDAIARHKQLGPLAEQNRKLNSTVAKLMRDLEVLKEQITQTKTEPQRDMAFDRIQEIEKQLREVRSTETALHQRLLSGQDLALEVEQAFREQEEQQTRDKRQRALQQQLLAQLLDGLQHDSHIMTVSRPETVVSLENPDTVGLRISATAEVAPHIRSLLKELDAAFEDAIPDEDVARIQNKLDQLELTATIVLADGREYSGTKPGLHNFKKARSYDLVRLPIDKPTQGNVTVFLPRAVVADIVSVKAHIRPPYEEPAGAEAYLSQVYERIRATVGYRMSRSTFPTQIGFRILSDGTIVNVIIRQTSGDEAYDQTMKQAVMRASPVAPFPSELMLPYLDTIMTFNTPN